MGSRSGFYVTVGISADQSKGIRAQLLTQFIPKQPDIAPPHARLSRRCHGDKDTFELEWTSYDQFCHNHDAALCFFERKEMTFEIWDLLKYCLMHFASAPNRGCLAVHVSAADTVQLDPTPIARQDASSLRSSKMRDNLKYTTSGSWTPPIAM